MANLHRYIALFFVFVFILFAAVQYNDPDPILWIPIYLVAAAFSLGVYLNKSPRILLLLIAIAYLVGAFFFWPESWHGLALNPTFKQQVEHARESLGLLFTALVMFYYFLISKK